MDLNNYVNQIYSNRNSIIYFWRKSRDWPASESGQSSEWCKVAKAGAEAAVVETVVYNVHCNSEKTGLHTLHSCSLQTSWSATVFALALSVSAAAVPCFTLPCTSHKDDFANLDNRAFRMLQRQCRDNMVPEVLGFYGLYLYICGL